ncbi:hypothetical protein [Maricaulis sp.]|uniref:hypothetical protein n=1 Tax=Maricaulis sp. TaxID=1486257 RepID=UPI0025B98DB4|nr:hypothetical protein [Maricaulis sp.]
MTRAGGRNDLVNGLALAVVVVLSVALTWMVAVREQVPTLERSALGFDGLVGWLAADGVEARRFLGQGGLSGDGVGLRILPLYDPDLETFGGHGFAPDAAYLADTQRNMFRHVVTMKAETLPTLVILPKWRDGVRLMGATHPEFLIHRDPEPITDQPDELVATAVDTDEAEPVRRDLPAIGDEAADEKLRPTYVSPTVLAVDTPAWEDIEISGFLDGTARLRAPQWMVLPDGCTALAGVPERALLGFCEFENLSYWVLSDPDILNNHGLSEAVNADLARQLVGKLADGGDVLVDYSTAVFLTAVPDEHQRSWADLARMLEPPFTWLWLAGAGLLALILWRAGLRGRPLITVFEQGHGAARQIALQAQARLMRNVHADGALIRTLVANRRQALAEAWLGRERRAGHAFQRTVALLRLKDRELAARLTDIFDRADALPDRIHPDVAVDALADVELVYQQALELA